jgi:RHS repeat-associated protein
MAQLLTPGGRVYQYACDAEGNTTERVMPDGHVHRSTYTLMGQLSTYTAPEGQPFERRYSPDGEVREVLLPSGRLETLRFDPVSGLLSRWAFPEGEVAFTYRAGTRQVEAVVRTAQEGGTPQALEQGYDGHLLTWLVSSGPASGRYDYTYDADFQLTSITLEGAAEIPLEYDRDGLLTGYGPFTLTRGGPAGAVTAWSGGPLSRQLTYDGAGRETGYVQRVNGREVYRVSRTYDGLNRIDVQVETIDGVARTSRFTYDEDSQLVQVERDGAVIEAYDYDLDRNRVTRQVDGTSISAVYDAQDRQQLLGDVVYRFDGDGLLEQRGDDTFEYSARGELLRATVGGRQVTYTYDGLGRRTSRKDSAGTLRYLYGDPRDQLRLTATVDDDGTVTQLFYDEHARLVAFQRGAAWYYVASDFVGSPRVVVDAQGKPVRRIDSDAFGRIRADSAPGFALPLGFAGGLPDDVTGLLDFGFRDYDPETGRWTARDSSLFAGALTNLYVYASNDPVNNRDLLGLLSIGASFFGGLGGGFKLVIDSGGFSVCGEAGIGIGSAVEVDFFDSREDHDQVETFHTAEASLAIGPCRIGGGLSSSSSGGGGGDCRASVKGSFGCGPVGFEGTLSGPDSGAPSPGATAKLSHDFKEGAQAKVTAGICMGRSW